MKILAIGNSFSQDATALMESLSPDVYVRNLYIPGCSLQTHCENIRNNAAAYEYQHNGLREGELITVERALRAQDWDCITVQQASRLSGKAESYEPYLTELLAYVRARSDAKIVFHRTWAYETNSSNPDFGLYGNNRQVMWQSILSTTENVCANHKLTAVDSGNMIQNLRGYDFFNPERGGISIYRDGFHLSLDYGRSAAACVWIRFFTGKIPSALYKNDEGYKCILRELSGAKSLAE